MGFEITWRADVYADAPQESSGAKFGIQGINVRARKPTSDDELAVEWRKLTCAIGRVTVGSSRAGASAAP